MTNEDHVVQIKRGVEVWNTWRKENTSILPDLRGADLRYINLRNANLRDVDFKSASLYRADLSGANLEGADLSDIDLRYVRFGSEVQPCAILSNANLRNVNLRGVNLIGLHLRNVNFSGADLGKAILGAADLRGAIFFGANLRGVNLRDANLDGADLRNAILASADLSDKDLSYQDFSGADLSDANLYGTVLCGVNFSNADLRQTTLIDSRLDGADLTGAKVWETQRGGWSIEDIICKYVYWDRDSNELTEYEDGDFERIFSEKPRIVLRYAGGISSVDLAMLPLIIERLQAEHPDSMLHIHSVQDDGGGPTVTITVKDLGGRSSEAFTHDIELMRIDLATIQQRLQQEEKLKLEFQHRYRAVVQDVLPMLMERALPKTEVHVGQITGPTTIEGTTMSHDTYNIHGQAGAIGSNARAHDMTFQQVQNQSSPNLKLAEELARLRTAMKEAEGKDEQDEAIGAVAAAEKAAIKGDGPTVLQHLKAAGQWTLGIAEKIGVAVAVEAIKRAM